MQRRWVYRIKFVIDAPDGNRRRGWCHQSPQEPTRTLKGATQKMGLHTRPNRKRAARVSTQCALCTRSKAAPREQRTLRRTLTLSKGSGLAVSNALPGIRMLGRHNSVGQPYRVVGAMITADSPSK